MSLKDVKIKVRVIGGFLITDVLLLLILIVLLLLALVVGLVALVVWAVVAIIHACTGTAFLALLF